MSSQINAPVVSISLKSCSLMVGVRIVCASSRGEIRIVPSRMTVPRLVNLTALSRGHITIIELRSMYS